MDLPEVIKLNQVNVEHIWEQILSFIHLEWRSLLHINLIKCPKSYFANAQMHHFYLCGKVAAYDML